MEHGLIGLTETILGHSIDYRQYCRSHSRSTHNASSIEQSHLIVPTYSKCVPLSPAGLFDVALMYSFSLSLFVS